MIARILGSVAQGEVAHGRERLLVAKRQAATEGKYRGGPRPFGFEKDGVTIRGSEAAVIRQATAAVLAGRSLAGIAKELNLGKVKPATRTRKDIDPKSPGYGEWKFSSLRDMLLRPRNAGLLAHGLPNRNSSTNNSTLTFEVVGKAVWDPIISEDDWRALVSLLTHPSRRMNTTSETRWLGSGIYRCGIDGCGAALRAVPHGGTETKKFARRYMYRCSASAHLTIRADPTDAYLREVVAELVRDPRIVAAMLSGDERLTADRETRSTLAARLTVTEHDYDNDLIDAKRYAAKRDKILAEIAAVDGRMARALRRSTSSAILGASDPGQAFLNSPIDAQRAVLSMVLSVKILTSKSVGVPVGGAWTARRIIITPISESEA